MKYIKKFEHYKSMATEPIYDDDINTPEEAKEYVQSLLNSKNFKNFKNVIYIENPEIQNPEDLAEEHKNDTIFVYMIDATFYYTYLIDTNPQLELF